MERQTPAMPTPSPLLRLFGPIEDALRSFFAQRSFPLYHLMEYQLGWRDERAGLLDAPLVQPRVHATLCILACQALGGATAAAMPSAIAVEMADQFVQVHADVQEGSQTRHRRPTVWWVWGPAQAINAGDGLHALARLSLLGRESENPAEHNLQLLQALDHACIRMCEGMYEELAFQERAEVPATAYLKMAREKDGALLGCALELGALAKGAGMEERSRLRAFGEEVGVALHIQEDIQSLWGQPLSGKDFGLDVLNKKKGYPIILALGHASTGQKRELGTLFLKRVLEPPDVERVKVMLDELGVRDKALSAVHDIYSKAAASLSEATGRAGAFDDLLEVTRWLALRT
ncbi:MAG: polyprenyl synthetase family protein [Chloroflexi bacterium]|nr:polyprenyl synthetase family protein [Chloroflexota bacterium]